MNRSTGFLDYGMMALVAILGTGSLLLFAASLAGAVTTTMGWPEPTRLAWDAGLSLAFFVQHSGMVRRQFRARLAGVLPDRYQGAFYTVSSGIVLACVALFWQRTETHLFVLEGFPLWVSRVCALLALGGLLWGGRALGAFDLLGLAPIRAHLHRTSGRSTPFTVRGPYRWVRHPLYACTIVLFWTSPDLTTDRLLFNVLWTGWMVVGTFLEERDLAAKFGEDYRRYQREVPMLVPWRGPAEPRN